MPETYDPGDQVPLSHLFHDFAGTPVDPTTVTLTVTRPDGTVFSTLTYPADIATEGLGRYTATLDLTGAAGGLWLYEWVATGPGAEESTGYFSVTGGRVRDLVREVRMQLGDDPEMVFVSGATDPTATTVTLASASGAVKLQTGSIWLEWDDGTGEVMRTDSAADQSALTVAVHRGLKGTTGEAHADGAGLLIGPRFEWPKVERALRQIVDLELWPHVWIQGEFDVTWNSATQLYPVPVSDIESITYAYENVSGWGRATHHVDFLAPAFAGAGYPNGALSVRSLPVAHLIHVSYRARPTLGNLSGAVESLAILGASARLMMGQEARHTAPSSGAIEGKVGDGANLRAGALLWQQFSEGRAKLMATLQGSEDTRRQGLRRVG